MHSNKYKYVSIVSAAAVLLLLGIYMWMTYRSVTKDIEERASAQLTWAMFYESYTRADLVTAGDTLSLPEARGNLSLVSSVEGMNDVLSRKYHSEISLDTVAMYVDSLLSVVGINRDVTVQLLAPPDEVVRQNNDRRSSWSLMTKPVSIRRDGSRAIRLALNNPYPELARRLSPLFLISAIILGFFAFFQCERFGLHVKHAGRCKVAIHAASVGVKRAFRGLLVVVHCKCGGFGIGCADVKEGLASSAGLDKLAMAYFRGCPLQCVLHVLLFLPLSLGARI